MRRGKMLTVLDIARGEVGEAETPLGSNNVKYNTWYYGHAVEGNAYPWCAVFVDWCFVQAKRGSELMQIENKAYCPSYVEWAMKNEKWVKPSSKPKVGYLVLYDWNSDGEADHIGFVSEVLSKKKFYAIEGNSSNFVRSMLRTTSNVLGYINLKCNKIIIKKTLDEIADEVINGIWGNGSARKKALKEAGYSYKKVQALVNEKLRKQNG